MCIEIVRLAPVLLREVLQEKVLLLRVNQQRPQENLQGPKHQLLLSRGSLVLAHLGSTLLVRVARKRLVLLL